MKLAKGGLDGLVALDDGRFLVSSWKANAIYEGRPGGEFQLLLADLNAPASIGFDSKRGRMLVPKMLDNQVLIYDLMGDPPAAAPTAPAAGAPIQEGAPAPGAGVAA